MKKLTATLLTILLLIPVTWAQERAIKPVKATAAKQALVIGNANYAYAGRLRNPVNDAKAIGSTLEELGFQVTMVTDASQRKMDQAIRRFGKDLKHNNGVGLFYYSGHGVQIEGENYLLPTDINPSNEFDVTYDAVPVGKLLGQMEVADNGMNVVILDACRNNPFARSFRSNSRGLAQVIAPTGTFISYSTAPGSVAADGEGDNGLFTAKLLEHMTTPGLPLERVFKRVRVDVQRESNNQQVPWDSSSVTGDFYFVPSVAAPSTPNTLDLEALEERKRQEQKQIKARWQQWQQQMQSDYEKVTAFEQKEIGNDLKLESWQLFLKNWSEDNPYSQQDGELRSMAEARVVHWMTVTIREMAARQLLQSFTFPDGGKYVGEFNYPWMHGMGIYTWPNGDKYVGAWKDHSRHGQGTMIFQDGRVQSGLWKDGEFVGANESETKTVTLYISEDDFLKDWGATPSSWESLRKSEFDHMYVGEVQDGVPNGQGTHTFPDGKKYVGEFKDGVPNGQGTLTWLDGDKGHKYVGEFRDGKYNGQGTHTWPDGNKYVGEFNDNVPNGQGTHTWQNGDKYVGEFRDGKRNGQGTMTTSDGHKYVGEWKDDKIHGQGTYTWRNGDVWSGPWKDGEFLGSQ